MTPKGPHIAAYNAECRRLGEFAWRMAILQGKPIKRKGKPAK